MSEQNKTNFDLILGERLALQRTELANQSTFLSFLRTSMYFLMAGLTIHNVFSQEGLFYFGNCDVCYFRCRLVAGYQLL